ncbi:fumarylacetoacetate hydrolase family protein [Alteromonas naphthalenivorans]|uniref:2-hydroxyhepta-2,4-diene-1,7-dioate isomerase n=1 Tax=Alteromonas naphthalenivorans TaxID=715451 RepID=F5ZFF4_ALTNA|nr:fumarylacetoacetate hydrolase family protein [Alteromonas naphthalenivorans]AEF05089.1 2-hydroxyhepta-2,4-diene-1,7-dioate isomerase [Alteromonas naphthalenivorans]
MGPVPLQNLSDIVDLDGTLFNQVKNLVKRLENYDPGPQKLLQSNNAFHDASTVRYSPILRPHVLLACGMAYKDHMREMNTPIPKKPAGFLKSPNSIIANGDPIILPSTDPNMVDFECELACVIGRPLYNVQPEDVLKHIAGFTMINELGSRSHVRAWLNAMEGTNPKECIELFMATAQDKQLPSFCPMGPVIETFDTFGDVNQFSIETKLNGEIMQSADSSDLIFTIAESLAYFSRWYKLMPGDVYSTGSPYGVGYARTPQRLLRDGDIIEVSCPKIGCLSNPVISA